MDLATMQTNVQTDLKDTTNSRFAIAEVQRAIARAVAEYSEVNPVLAHVDLVMPADVPGSGAARWFDLSAQVGYMWCEAVEYPIDNEMGPSWPYGYGWPGYPYGFGWVGYPGVVGAPTYRLFREDRMNKKVYVMGREPTQGDSLRFWYAQAHSLNGGSTIPVEHEDLIALGAGALCVQMQAEYAIDRLSPSALAPSQYLAWSEKRLAEFRAKLQTILETRMTSVGGNPISWGSARI